MEPLKENMEITEDSDLKFNMDSDPPILNQHTMERWVVNAEGKGFGSSSQKTRKPEEVKKMIDDPFDNEEDTEENEAMEILKKIFDQTEKLKSDMFRALIFMSLLQTAFTAFLYLLFLNK